MQSELSKDVLRLWQSPSVLAVSGGQDSMLLLYTAAALAREGLISPPREVFYLDHGLRNEASEERRLIQKSAQYLGLPFADAKVDIQELALRTDTSIEEAGRLSRYRHLRLRLQAHGISVVLTAHHANDYLESLLLHLIRGGGQRALGTLELLGRLPGKNKSGALLFRPFLLLSQRQIRSIVQEFGIPFLEDASNRSRKHRRNRLRADLVPILLEEGLDPVKLWKNFHNESEYIAPSSQAPLAIASVDLIRLDRRLFAALCGNPLANLKRILDPAFLALGLAPVERKALKEILKQLLRQETHASNIGWENRKLLIWATPKSDLWIVRKDAACLRPFRERNENHEKLSQAIPEEARNKQSRREVVVNWNHQTRTYVLEPGEEFCSFEEGMCVPLPTGGRKRLFKIFQEYKIPVFARQTLPLIRDRESGLVRRVCLSFWEGMQDARF